MDTEHLRGKSILVTGGTGTFGHAVVRRLLAVRGIPRIVVFSRDEYKQHHMQREYADGRLRFLIGDIRDKNRLLRAFNGVDIVIHAAALKQVPALEYNPVEAIETNIIGTRNVIDAALDRDVPQVLVISSDKAVQPINLYGATKMCAERLAIAANVYRGARGKTRISVMRYGNVLGSRGSLLEIIEKQRPSGAITLTDKEMTRFWIHIDSVVDVVFNALRLMESGEIFVPKMKAARVADLIAAIAPECKLTLIGMRPGEKMHEALITEYEAKRTRDLGDIYVVEPEFSEWGRKSPFAKYPHIKKGAAYASDNLSCLLPKKRAHEVLEARATRKGRKSA